MKSDFWRIFRNAIEPSIFSFLSHMILPEDLHDFLSVPLYLWERNIFILKAIERNDVVNFHTWQPTMGF
jgi:hypothetical protein